MGTPRQFGLRGPQCAVSSRAPQLTILFTTATPLRLGSSDPANDEIRRVSTTRSRSALTGFLLAFLLAGGCTVAPGTEPDAEQGTVTDFAASTAELRTASAALRTANLASVLTGAGPFTFFAPVDAAFAGLPAGMVEALMTERNRDVLVRLLSFHVVEGKYDASQLRDGQRLKTLAGGSLIVAVRQDQVSINGVALRTQDMPATNGVVHTLHGVLTSGLNAMQLAAVTPELSTLVTATNESGLTGTLAGTELITLFAPGNSAFAKLDPAVVQRMLLPANRSVLQKVLGYHLLSGRVLAGDLQEGSRVVTLQGQPVHIRVKGGRRVNAANIVTSDIRVSNGVIHLIDGVLQENLDLIDVSTLSGFDSFVDAVRRTGDVGLISALRYGGMTVFAPSDSAFAAVGDAMPQPAAALADLLRYHIVPGHHWRGTLAEGDRLVTLLGDTLLVEEANGAGMGVRGTGNRTTLMGEVGAANGVIHSVDAVLVPAP